MNGWVSPRLGVRFDISGPKLKLFGPDGQRFLTLIESDKERRQAAIERDAERQRAEQIASERDAERQRAEHMAALLRALGIEPPA